MAFDELVVDWPAIDKWSSEEMKKYMGDPATRARIDAVISTPEVPALTEAEQEAAAAAAAAAAEAEAARVAEEAATASAAAAAAEALRLEAEAKAAQEAEAAAIAAKAAEEAAKPKKLVDHYQIYDENNNPIGRPTHLEAWSQEEMDEKRRVAHIEATRAFHRLKSRKLTVQEKEPAAPVRLTSDELLSVATDLRSDDAEKALAAQRKIDADNIIARELAAKAETERAIGAQVSYTFMRNHLADFNPCAANGKILADYLHDNNMPWTVDNLEIAFAAVESQLAVVEQLQPPVPKTPVTEPALPVVNPPAAAPTAPTAVPVVAVPPVAAAVNPPVAAPKVPSGGLIPGQTLTGRAPVAKVSTLTKKEIRDWSKEEMRKQMRIGPERVAEIERVMNSK